MLNRRPRRADLRYGDRPSKRPASIPEPLRSLRLGASTWCGTAGSRMPWARSCDRPDRSRQAPPPCITSSMRTSPRRRPCRPQLRIRAEVLRCPGCRPLVRGLGRTNAGCGCGPSSTGTRTRSYAMRWAARDHFLGLSAARFRRIEGRDLHQTVLSAGALFRDVLLPAKHRSAIKRGRTAALPRDEHIEGGASGGALQKTRLIVEATKSNPAPTIADPARVLSSGRSRGRTTCQNWYRMNGRAITTPRKTATFSAK